MYNGMTIDPRRSKFVVKTDDLSAATSVAQSRMHTMIAALELLGMKMVEHVSWDPIDTNHKLARKRVFAWPTRLESARAGNAGGETHQVWATAAPTRDSRPVLRPVGRIPQRREASLRQSRVSSPLLSKC